MLDPLVQCYFSRGLHWQRTSTLSTHKITRQNNRSGRLKGAPLRAHTLEAWCPRLGFQLVFRVDTCPQYAASGPDHLCPYLCYYRKYEASRAMEELRCAAKRAGLAKEAEGWTAKLTLQPKQAEARR
eukprot:4534133-Pyramimonas_sp.AAC.2